MKKRSIYIALGLIFLALVIFDVVVWIRISSDSSKSFEAVVQEYLDFYGGVFKNAIISTLRNILFCIIAFIFFVQAVKINKGSKQPVLFLLIGFTGFLGFWQLWSLM